MLVRAPHEGEGPCWTCKLTGALALTCVGISALSEARRIGLRGPRRRWARFLVAAGVTSLAAGGARLIW